jgi:spoIIIJ-associated protein
MEIFEFEGKNATDAIENASRQLNVPKDELNIEILEPGSSGIFGLVGGRKARIRVTVVKKAPEPPPVEESEALVAEEPEAPPAVQGDAVAVAGDSLKAILDLIPIEASVTARVEEDRIILSIEGDQSGILIGRKGRTLDALQFIVSKIVNKSLDQKVRVVIDSENYRERRKESLVEMALKIGEKAKRIRKPITTGPLNPHDRRIIHLALKDDEELDTKSRGDGVLKKVLIIPRK